MLHDACLKLKPSKCERGIASCMFLGFVIGQGHSKLEDTNIAVIKSFPKPCTISKISQAIIQISYWALLPTLTTFTEFTKKTAPDNVQWTNSLDSEYSYLQSCLCSLPSLYIPIPGDVLYLQTNASGVDVGAVLSIRHDSRELPAVYYSRKLTPSERNYSATELEGLANVSSINLFAVYLYGVCFTVETDHKTLAFLQSSKNLNGRLTRWALQLLNPLTGMSGLSRQQRICRQKKRNLISHCQIFIIKISKKTLKPFSITTSNYTSIDVT